MTQRIIQISAVPSGSTNDETLYALADDGSTWFLLLDRGNWVWQRLPELPQYDDREDHQEETILNESPQT